MKDIDEIRRDNLRLLEREYGGPAAAASRIGMSLAQFANLRDGAKDSKTGRPRGMRKETARRIEKAFERPVGWLDVEHASLESDVTITDDRSPLIKRLLPEGKGNVVTWETPEDLEHDDDRVWIDRYDYRFSAGTGVIQWEIRQKKALPFDIGFFKALGVRPQDCRLAQVHGRSMEPYLFNRDMMMICSAKTVVKDGLIYAVVFEDEPLVKQIFKEPEGALRLHSYNPEFPDKIITAGQLEGLQVAGEVIYRSGSGLAGGN